MHGIFEVGTPFFFGEAVYPDGGSYGPIQHPNLCLFAMVQGRAEIDYDGGCQPLESGQTGIIFNTELFKVRLPRGEVTHILWCETPNPSLLPEKRDSFRNLPATLDATDQLFELLKMGIGLGRASALRNSLALSVLNSFVHGANQAELDITPLPRAIARVKQHIDDHFLEPMSLEELAKIAALTPHHLSRKFKQHLQLSPVKYTWQLRLQKGLDQLEQTGLTVAEVAYSSGFQNQFHFSRLVKQAYGLTPTEIRTRAWQRREQV